MMRSLWFKEEEDEAGGPLNIVEDEVAVLMGNRTEKWL